MVALQYDILLVTLYFPGCRSVGAYSHSTHASPSLGRHYSTFPVRPVRTHQAKAGSGESASCPRRPVSEARPAQQPGFDLSDLNDGAQQPP